MTMDERLAAAYERKIVEVTKWLTDRGVPVPPRRQRPLAYERLNHNWGAIGVGMAPPHLESYEWWRLLDALKQKHIHEVIFGYGPGTYQMCRHDERELAEAWKEASCV